MSEMGVIEMSEREVRKQFQREMLEKLIDSELELRIVRPPLIAGRSYPPEKGDSSAPHHPTNREV